MFFTKRKHVILKKSVYVFSEMIISLMVVDLSTLSVTILYL